MAEKLYCVMDDTELFYERIYSKDFVKEPPTDKLLTLISAKHSGLELNPRSYLALLDTELKSRGIEVTRGSKFEQLVSEIKALGVNIDEIMGSDPNAYYHFKTEEEYTLEDRLFFLKCHLELDFTPTDSEAELMTELKKYGLKLDGDADIKQLAENLRLIREHDTKKYGTYGT